MTDYNTIGIEGLDWKRIKHLMKLGLFASFIALAADCILGYGTCNEALTGFDQYFSRYLSVSEERIALSAVLGLIGISIECLCFFSIYRLIASKSKEYAHKYRSVIFGMLILGPLVHVLCCITISYGKLCYQMDPSAASNQIIRFVLYYLLPPTVLFLIFFILTAVVQFKAFSKGYTPYPKNCRIYSYLAGFIVPVLMRFMGNNAIAYAVSTGWISWGTLFMYAGLLKNMKRPEL